MGRESCARGLLFIFPGCFVACPWAASCATGSRLNYDAWDLILRGSCDFVLPFLASLFRKLDAGVRAVSVLRGMDSAISCKLKRASAEGATLETLVNVLFVKCFLMKTNECQMKTINS